MKADPEVRAANRRHQIVDSGTHDRAGKLDHGNRAARRQTTSPLAPRTEEHIVGRVAHKPRT